MRIAVTANGTDLDSQASPVFGRCRAYIFTDTETMEFESLENPAIAAPGGAGIQAAQFVVERGAQAVVTGNTGPNAFNVLQAANVPVYLFAGGTVREAVEALKAGQLQLLGEASARAGMGMRRGMGRGMRMGRGMGIGWRAAASPTMAVTPPSSGSTTAREEEIAALKGMADELRNQLAEVMERLDRLEKGD